MASINDLILHIDNTLSTFFKKHIYRCKTINFISGEDKQFIGFYSLKDVVKCFIKNDGDVDKKLEVLLNLIDKKNKSTIIELKEKYIVKPNMTIESYTNYQTLLSFSENEMYDIYVDKIGLYKTLLTIIPEPLLSINNSIIDFFLFHLEKEYSEKLKNDDNKKLENKLNSLIKDISLLISDNKQLVEKNINLNKNIKTLQEDIIETKEILIKTFNDLLKMNIML